MELTLDALTRDRLFDLARVFGLRLVPRTLHELGTMLTVPVLRQPALVRAVRQKATKQTP